MQYQSLNFIRSLSRDELSELYFAVILKSLALSLVGVFIPIYMYKELEFSIDKIIYFFLIWSVLFAAFTPFVAKLSSRFGLKHMIVASVPFDILFLGLLVLLKNNDINYVYPAIVYALSGTLFWTGFNIEFAKFSNKERRGRELGSLYSLLILSGIIGPFVGGLILTYLGFTVLFYIFSVLLFVSAIPLLMTPDNHEKTKFSFKRVFHKTYFKDTLIFAGLGTRIMTVTLFWPLFIYTILKGYIGIGVLITASSLIIALFSFYIGKLADTKKRKNLLRIGALVHSLVWAVRWVASSFYQIFIVELFSGLSFVLADIPFSSMFYDKMNKRNKAEYVIFREIGFSLGKIIVLLSVLFTETLIAGFFVASIGSLAYLAFKTR
ncbi:MFS transporter [Candidatus Woesearchaeota archaeon]|nr:MFS transporter [Candidatus Woesearchaeota archaeon]